MTKKEIVQAIAAKLGLTIQETKPIVQKTFAAIIDTLAEEGRVELRGFGVFELRRRKARTARNPRTGETVMVPARCTVVFKPGQMMEERVAKECRDGVDGQAGHRKRPVKRTMGGNGLLGTTS